jgi:predicted nucleotidyltransferase
MKINISDKHLAIIKNILRKYNYSFYLFGSRITDKAKQFSDVDLFYTDDIPIKHLLQLEEEFENSDLPYKVDLVDYNKCDHEFQAIMRAGNICLWYSHPEKGGAS